MAKAWREDRDNVTSQAREISAALAERAAPPAGQVLDLAATPRAAPRLCSRSRATRPSSPWPRTTTRPPGGFGGAPKFPPSMVLEFLLRHSESARQRNGEPAATALGMVDRDRGGDGPRGHV